MTVAVEISRVRLMYGTNPVLSDISFSVGKGEFFIIIGPNGSGKTSLIKTLSGILPVTGGEIRILETPIHRYGKKALARKVALVPQTVPVDFPFTVRETVLMGRTPHLGMLGLESRSDMELVSRVMEFTGITEFADRKIENLSGGERQRVFVARAVCQSSDIILLDEPTASLDMAHQARLMDLMEALKREHGTTIVMVSHDINLAALYADRILLLKDGRIVDQGRPSDVLTYKTLETVYGCTLLVDTSPLGDYPRVTLVPGKFNPNLGKRSEP